MWRLSEQAQALAQRLHDLLSWTSWFGRARHEEAVIDLLARIGDREEPAALFSVARCLLSTSPQVSIAAARTAHRLLSIIPPEQLIHLGGLLPGDSWDGDDPDAWDGLSPRGVPALASDPETRTSVLGLLSFHRNGHVRQEAVRLLAGSAGGTELPFLLVRQNDWVGGIGVEARRAVNERLVPDYLPPFVRSLPLVIHLLAFRRCDLSPVVRSVVGMLALPENDALLGEVIGTSSGPVRRRVVQIALEVAGAIPPGSSLTASPPRTPSSAWPVRSGSGRHSRVTNCVD